MKIRYLPVLLTLAIFSMCVFGEDSEKFQNISFSELASKQGATANGENCRFEKKELVKIETDLFSEHARFQKDEYAGDWSCLQLKAHLKDDTLKNCMPDPDDLFDLSPDEPISITGKETYHFGSIPLINTPPLGIKKPYNYEVSKNNDDKIVVTVKINFTGEFAQNPANYELIQKKLSSASDIWSKQSPEGKVKFNFLFVKATENPGFTVKLKPKTNGALYNAYWESSLFTEAVGTSTIAHEIGHMMGIPDEYDPFRDTVWQVKNSVDTRRCNVRGLMCDNYAPKLYPYYYYLILRRAACSEREQLPARELKKAVAETSGIFGKIKSLLMAPKRDCQF